jgi:dihydrofolate reductase
MRKLVISLVVSVDGYINGPGGEFIGPEWSADLDAWNERMFARFDTLIYGRTSWEKMSEFWPSAGRDKAFPAPMHRLAVFMNDSRKIVFSRTLQDVSAWPNSELATEPVRVVMDREKQRHGKDIVVFAGASMAQSAMRAAQVDEIWLLTIPELFGHGTRLFDGHNLRSRLNLQEEARMDTGAIFTRYAVINPSASGQ